MKIRTIELDTLGPNERARHVYEKSGFKYVGKIPNFYNHYGKYCDKVILYQEVR
jgi:RimJ/RimL family protein N-acetyltransferase